jgi:two-component system, chemotaxis family, response regulator Rcp1
MKDAAVLMLVVEDNPADLVFFEEALRSTELPARLAAVDNGGDALAFLQRRGNFTNAERPDVVVLDLNIPLRNGREVLESMAADPSLRQIPVAVLTTSESEEYLAQLYPTGLCRYMVKTGDFEQLMGMVKEIHALAVAVKEQPQTA